MITKNKLRIKKGQTYLCDYEEGKRELRIIKVIKREGDESLVKHQYGWDKLSNFVVRDPVYLGVTRRVMGIPFGYKS